MSITMTACPGCGAIRQTRSPEAHCHTCRKSGVGRVVPDVAWMVAEGARLRECGIPPGRYEQIRAARHPWLTLTEAAHELDVTEGRITQLIADGTLTSRYDPKDRRRKHLRAADVFAYLPKLRKKRTTS